MRQRDFAIEITEATPLSDGRRAHLLMEGDAPDEIWLVPAIFTAKSVDSSLPYWVKFTVEVNPANSLAEIARLEAYQWPDGEPVHATGLRDLPLATLLKAAVRAAAVCVTKDDALGGYVLTEPAKKPRPLQLARATDRRARSKKRKNTPRQADIDALARTVAELRRRGVKRPVDVAAKHHGLSRAAAYRWMSKATASKKPTTKKRGKR
jgi:hypothetical protein